MYEIDFSVPAHIHFIGIGGISMSALAEILKTRGFTVSGSDSHASPLTERLEEEGIRVVIGQKAENITDDIDVVVYTAAVHPDNPEYAAAEAKGLPILSRAELLGQIMRNYRTAVAVAGTHGKTTTTSMIAEMLVASEADPTITVGGILPSIGGNVRIGGSGTFVTEACEYTNSFLSFFPTVALILNVDADHLDFFKDLDDIASSFHRFAGLLPEDGTLIIGKDSKKYEDVVRDLNCRIVTFGFDPASDYTAENITFDELGHASFDCVIRGEKAGRISLSVPGRHNILNALAAAACGRTLGIPDSIAFKGIGSFTGTNRRFEIKGKLGDITVVDDYAHHPSEIRATLEAAKMYPHRDLWLVFQPHTYTRTQALLGEFADALSLADHIVLADIYAAREKNTIGISSDDLRALLAEKGKDAVYFPDFGEIEDYLLEHCAENDLLMTMGAGNVFEIGEALLGRS